MHAMSMRIVLGASLIGLALAGPIGQDALAARDELHGDIALLARHEHHGADMAPPDPSEPLDWIIKAHIATQVLTWGIMLPAGAVLGLVRSRWHVPLQVVSIAITLALGFPAGHHHGGRTFLDSAHAHFATFCFWYIIAQGCLGIFLRLHVLEGSLGRKLAVRMHGVLGKAFMVISWTQLVLGGFASLGQGYGEHLGQSLAHGIMGSSFIGYGCIMLLLLRCGASWIKRRGASPEMFDNATIAVWGCVNTFTEHNFFGQDSRWSHKDYQHVSLGVVWWAGGSLGIWLSRGGRRNLMPALLLVVTGYAFGGHHQPSELSTSVHTMFGYCLIAAGLARGIEVAFVLQDAQSPEDPTKIRSFQLLAPLLLVMSGVAFMSGHEEAIALIESIGMDGVTYSLLIWSVAFVIFCWAELLIWLYQSSGRNAEPSPITTSDNGHLRSSFQKLVHSWFSEKDAVKANGNGASYHPVTDPLRPSEDVELDDRWTDEDERD